MTSKQITDIYLYTYVQYFPSNRHQQISFRTEYTNLKMDIPVHVSSTYLVYNHLLQTT